MIFEARPGEPYGLRVARYNLYQGLSTELNKYRLALIRERLSPEEVQAIVSRSLDSHLRKDPESKAPETSRLKLGELWDLVLWEFGGYWPLCLNLMRFAVICLIGIAFLILMFSLFIGFTSYIVIEAALWMQIL